MVSFVKQAFMVQVFVLQISLVNGEFRESRFHGASVGVVNFFGFSIGFNLLSGENRWLVADEPVEFEK